MTDPGTKALLNSTAVGRQDGEKSGQLLGAYLQTKNPALVFSHSLAAAPAGTNQNPPGTLPAGM